MNLTSKSDIRDTLKSYGLQPNKRLGQNFLIDKNIINIIVDAIDTGKNDTILEVGPGLGVLTDEMVQKAKHVTAVEKDRGLIPHLNKYFSEKDNFELINCDIMDIPPSQILEGISKFVSNLPYSCGTRILLDFVLSKNAPKEIVVMVQLEVAQRIVAETNSPEYGLLSLLTGVKYRSEIIKVVSQNCFWPRPDVKSAVVKLIKRDKPLLNQNEIKIFRKLTKAAFSQRRKKISNCLKKITGTDIIEKAGISSSLRPEEISLQQWVSLTKTILNND
jgi:16S rRNA (adenine1518-N6/adenine1519-N6)-dimethyltransferase